MKGLVDTFANRLKKAMQIRNIKATELSEKTGIAKSSLSEYINGKYEAKQDGVYLLSKALDVNEAWLMGLDVAMERIEYVYADEWDDLSTDYVKVKDINGKTIYKKKKFYDVPIVGKITAGKPIEAKEYHEGYLPVDPNIYGLSTSDNLFYLRVSGESMNLKVHNGDYALIHKQDFAENGDIIVAIVNSDDEATLKKYKRLNDQFVLLEPMSTDPTIEAITVDLKNTKFQIIGKAIGQFGKF